MIIAVVTAIHPVEQSVGQFWLYKYTNGVGGTAYFEFETANTMAAGEPYLIAVPGDRWGDMYNLTNKEFTFHGENVSVKAGTGVDKVAGEYAFKGNYTKADCSKGYKLNEKGDFFELQNANTEKPFRAFFASTEETSSSASAKVLRLDFSETNGINMMESKEVSLENATIYNLNGQRIKQLQRGVNIINGKKIIVK